MTRTVDDDESGLPEFCPSCADPMERVGAVFHSNPGAEVLVAVCRRCNLAIGTEESCDD